MGWKGELANNLTTPFRLFLPSDFLNDLGLRSMQNERVNAALRYCKGRVLDVGCGENKLALSYLGDALGVDIFPYAKMPHRFMRVLDAKHLPFKDHSFETVTLLATLDHIPAVDRISVIQEIKRVLAIRGRVIVTVLPEFLAFMRNLLCSWWCEYDQHTPGAEEGMNPSDVMDLFLENGFHFVAVRRFVLGLNRLYVFRPCGS